jgi:hypothetical protein
MAQQQEVNTETLQTGLAFLGGEGRNQKEAATRLDELSRKSEELDQSIRILSVQAIREAGLDPLQYELDSTDLRPRLRALGERERLLMPKRMAEQVRPLLDERAKVEGEMTGVTAWLDELHNRLSYLKGIEYSRTETEIPKLQARYDQLLPRLRELNERTDQLSSDVILATGHDPAWYELPTASTKEGQGHAPELIEDKGQFYLVVYLKVPPAPTWWEQVVARRAFDHGPRRWRKRAAKTGGPGEGVPANQVAASFVLICGMLSDNGLEKPTLLWRQSRHPAPRAAGLDR